MLKDERPLDGKVVRSPNVIIFLAPLFTIEPGTAVFARTWSVETLLCPSLFDSLFIFGPSWELGNIMIDRTLRAL